jgi:hypothetical protein
MEHECRHHQDKECDCEKTHVDGCCCGGDHFQRQYQTQEEQIAELEGYLKELKLEVQAVEEHLQNLRK